MAEITRHTLEASPTSEALDPSRYTVIEPGELIRQNLAAIMIDDQTALLRLEEAFTSKRITRERLNFYKEELESWAKYRIAFQTADRVVIPYMGGIGDRLYFGAIAQELARQFPTKEIVYETDVNTPCSSDPTLPNFVIKTISKRIGRGLTTQESIEEIQGKKVLYLNLDDVNVMREKYILTPIRLKKNSLHHEAELLTKTTELPAYQKFFNRIFNRKSTALTFFDRAEPTKAPLGFDLWGIWNRFVIKSAFKKTTQLQDNAQSSGSLDGYADAHFTESLMSKLHSLLGVEFPEGFPDMPLPEVEIPASSTYDYFFCYDAGAESDAKMIGSATMIDAITEIRLKNPSARIALVVGLEHPDTARQVTEEFIDITLITGSFTEVLLEGVKSENIVVSDSSLGHAFDQLILRAQKKFPPGRIPKLFSFFSQTSNFPVTQYGLRAAKTLVARFGLGALPREVLNKFLAA